MDDRRVSNCVDHGKERSGPDSHRDYGRAGGLTVIWIAGAAAIVAAIILATNPSQENP
jgi:hypothetical protein